MHLEEKKNKKGVRSIIFFAGNVTLKGGEDGRSQCLKQKRSDGRDAYTCKLRRQGTLALTEILCTLNSLAKKKRRRQNMMNRNRIAVKKKKTHGNDLYIY